MVSIHYVKNQDHFYLKFGSMMIYKVPLDFTKIRRDSLYLYLRHVGIETVDDAPLHLCLKTDLVEIFADIFGQYVEHLVANPEKLMLKIPLYDL